MPCLIPEILFEIGKKLMEDGNSDTVIQFALSGKQQFQTMKNLFASATTLKLYADYYDIGWENNLCKFPNNRLAKLLLDSNGNRVDTLFIEKYISEYQSVLDRIAEKRQLTSIYVSNKFCSNPSYMINYLPILSSSLKNMSIPSCLMNEKFQFNEFQYLKFCCKTDLLEFSSDYGIFQFFFDLDYMKSFQCSPHLSSVKQLTFNGYIFEKWFNLDCDKLMNCFSLIEIFKFNILTEPFDHRYLFGFLSVLRRSIKLFIDNIKKATKVPSKMNVTFFKVGFLKFNNCEFI
uniref:Uncharacterized protein n=1 Tax=Panagrolaimus davidi TaxID=227884 RepID=A0A914QLD1_9BILA